MALKGSRPQFSKLGPATKMTLQVDSSNFSTMKASRYMKNNIMIHYILEGLNTNVSGAKTSFETIFQHYAKLKSLLKYKYNTNNHIVNNHILFQAYSPNKIHNILCQNFYALNQCYLYIATKNRPRI